jgi:hypothetical protein
MKEVSVRDYLNSRSKVPLPVIIICQRSKKVKTFPSQTPLVHSLSSYRFALGHIRFTDASNWVNLKQSQLLKPKLTTSQMYFKQLFILPNKYIPNAKVTNLNLNTSEVWTR